MFVVKECRHLRALPSQFFNLQRQCKMASGMRGNDMFTLTADSDRDEVVLRKKLLHVSSFYLFIFLGGNCLLIRS